MKEYNILFIIQHAQFYTAGNIQSSMKTLEALSHTDRPKAEQHAD